MLCRHSKASAGATVAEQIHQPLCHALVPMRRALTVKFDVLAATSRSRLKNKISHKPPQQIFIIVTPFPFYNACLSFSTIIRYWSEALRSFFTLPFHIQLRHGQLALSY